VAREIVRDYEQVQNLSARAQDAKAKLELLQNEKPFNHAITSSLEDIWSVDKDLNEAESALAAGTFTEVATIMDWLSSRTKQLVGSHAKEINYDRLTRIRHAVVEGLTVATTSMIEFEKSERQQRVTVNYGKHGLWYAHEI
jgi:hypothetical protein